MAYLELDNITVRFGGLVALSELSFSINSGEIVGLIGPNGAGKTTVFNLISGVYPLDEGSVLVGGRDISNTPSRHRIKYGLSRSFQNIRLMPHLTALENVIVGQHHRSKSLTQLFYPMGLERRHRRSEEARAALG